MKIKPIMIYLCPLTLLSKYLAFITLWFLLDLANGNLDVKPSSEDLEESGICGKHDSLTSHRDPPGK